MDEKQFKILIEKLDLLPIKINAINSIKDKEYGEKVIFLLKVGFQRKEIAKLLGKTPKQINDALYDRKRKKRKKK